MNKVSVIVPVRNGERYLASCIDSLLSQTFEDFELIVIDDGSSDRTDEILSSYLSKTKRLRKVRLVGRGQTIALNVGLAVATGEYLVNLDADDVAEKDRIQQQVSFMEDRPRVAACGSAVSFVDPEGDLLGKSAFPEGHDSILKRLQQADPSFYHSSSILRASCVRAAGGYDESYPLSAEIDMWLKLSDHGELANLTNTLTQKRLHLQSLSNQFSSQKDRCCVRAAKNYQRRHSIALSRHPISDFRHEDYDSEPLTRIQLEAKWYQMAVESGNLKTARKYAWQKTRNAPFSLQHWVEAAKLQIQASNKAA